MEELTFIVSVNNDDWDRNIAAWRCSALRIPTSKVNAIYFGGQKIDDRLYKIDKSLATVFWSGDIINKPEQAAISITLEEKLSTEAKTLKWKRLAIILPFLASIITALISLIPNLLNYNFADQNSKENSTSAIELNDLGITATFKSENGKFDYVLSQQELNLLLKKENIYTTTEPDQTIRLKFEFTPYQLRKFKGFKFQFGLAFYKKLGVKYMINEDWYTKPINDNIEFSLINFDNKVKFFETDIQT